MVSAPATEREDLLMELQQFAFRGIPNARSMGRQAEPDDFVGDCEAAEAPPESPRSLEASQALISQRKKHTELINQLKCQLEELEGYAYESGEGDMPSSVLMERQRVVMEQLKARYFKSRNALIQLGPFLSTLTFPAQKSPKGIK